MNYLDPNHGFNHYLRGDMPELLSQAEMVLGEPLVCNILDSIPNFVFILNNHRQVIFANQAVCNAVGFTPEQVISGLMVGDVLGCQVAKAAPRGCSSGEKCATCPALKAIRLAQKNQPAQKECALALENNGQSKALDILVTVSPIKIGGQDFILVNANDISDQKRRRSLERIFFHDILNTAGGLRGFSELLMEEAPEDLLDMAESIHAASDSLVREITSQKTLLAAENDELEPEPQDMNSLDMLEELSQRYRGHQAAAGRQIKIDPEAAAVEFVSDPSLLGRVLANMLKNALEACCQGETVTLGVRVPSGDELEFWVHNPGEMPRKVQLQIFKRSFSTKGGNRGLGTYSIKLLTERYLGGRVSFGCDPETGITFRVCLPKFLRP